MDFVDSNVAYSQLIATYKKKASKLAKFEKFSVLTYVSSSIDQNRIYKEVKFVNIVKTLLSEKKMHADHIHEFSFPYISINIVLY